MPQYNKKTKKWRADIAINGKRYRRRGFSEKKYAEMWQAQIRINSEKGTLDIPVQDNIEIEKVLEKYIKHAEKYKTKETVRTEKSNLRTWMKFFDHKSIRLCREIKSRTWLEYIEWREKEISKRTINLGLIAIRQAFRWGIEFGLIQNNPFEEAKLFKEEKPGIPVYLKKSEIDSLEQLMGKNDPSSFYHIFATLVRTGMRVGELCSLKFDNYKDGKIILSPSQTKAKKQRTIPLVDSLKSILDTRKEIAKSLHSEYLFCTSSGKPNDKFNILRRFKRVLKRAEQQGLIDDMKAINIHTLRKTFISQLVMAGEDPVKVMAIVGHTEWSTMKRYLQLAPGYLDSIRDNINF